MGSKEGFYYNITALHPEVTGSCLLVDVHYPNGRQTKFLVDCGLFQEEAYNQLNAMKFPFKSENIEFVLITHNHADHMARLPMLLKEGFNGKIYATKATAQLMQPAIKNSFQIMKEDARKKDKKQLYDEIDVDRVFSSTESCELEETVYVDRNIKVTFFDNGHLIGAAMILVQISYPGREDINIFFTGDYKPNNIFKDVRELPDWVLEMPLSIVIESTYGYMETCEIDYHFERDVIEKLRQGKSLLTFVLAQGRAQEILFCLKKMQDEGKISKTIPIYLDGTLAHAYTLMYEKSNLGIDEYKKDFLPENLTLVNKDNRQAVLLDRRQKIVLTTSGMGDYGPAQIYIREYISRENIVFYFTSYLAEGTFGYQLKNPKDGKVVIQGQEYAVKVEILFTSEFSSHAKADELEALLKMFKNIKLVLVNHGQKEVKEQFAQRVENAKVAKRVEILGEHTIRVSRFGFIKAMGAKLYSITKVETRSENTSKHEVRPTAKKCFKYRVCFQH